MNAKILGAVLFSGFVIGCANSNVKREAEKSAGTKGPSIEAKQVAMEEEAQFVTEFTFPKGSAKLSEKTKKELKRLVDNAKKNGEVKELKVITWGDVEYPSVHTSKLSKSEVDLVIKRNNAIRDYMKGFADADIETYSMAERPNALQEMLETSEARLKKSLEVAGVPTTDTAVKTPSKASKSIVMVITE